MYSAEQTSEIVNKQKVKALLQCVDMERINKSIHNLPPGFRFQPSDQELILHYLTNKLTSSPLPAPVIADINLYHFDPWHLPGKALFGEEEWYFFTPRDRKYPNGARPNRATVSGYWKATGIDKPIFLTSSAANLNIIIGVKKSLVFYNGRPPKGVKTDWIMHEYRLQQHDPTISTNNSNSMRLDDWVLCRVRMKTIPIRNILEDDSADHLSSGISSSSSSYSQETTASLQLLSPGTQSNPEQLPLLPYLFDPPDFSCFQTNLTNNMSSNGEKKQITAYQAASVFDVSTACSDDDPTSIINFHCSSLWYPEVEEGQSVPGNSSEPFTPSNADDNVSMNLIDIDQTQVFQSLMADPWRPL